MCTGNVSNSLPCRMPPSQKASTPESSGRTSDLLGAAPSGPISAAGAASQVTPNDQGLYFRSALMSFRLSPGPGIPSHRCRLAQTTTRVLVISSPDLPNHQCVPQLLTPPARSLPNTAQRWQPMSIRSLHFLPFLLLHSDSVPQYNPMFSTSELSTLQPSSSPTHILLVCSRTVCLKL